MGKVNGVRCCVGVVNQYEVTHGWKDLKLSILLCHEMGFDLERCTPTPLLSVYAKSMGVWERGRVRGRGMGGGGWGNK